MKTFGRYFSYKMKQCALRTLVFILLALAVTMSIVPQGLHGFNPEVHDTSLYMYAIILCVFSTLIPILETAGFKNRRNLDTLYFFPIKRFKMALVHYLCGFIQVVAIYSVSFFSAWIYLEAQTNYFALNYMLPYYFLSLLLGLVLYSIFMFIFGQANTVADGVLFCGLWVFVFFAVGGTIRGILLYDFLIETDYWEITGKLQDWTLVYAPVNNLTVIFQDIIEVNKPTYDFYYTHRTAMEYREMAYMFIPWAVVGLASAYGYFVTFVKKGAEKAGEISDSWFGYRLLIPVYGYSLLLSYNFLDLLTVVIFGLMVIGYVIYRRGFKLKMSDYIIIAGGVVAFILGGIIAN